MSVNSKMAAIADKIRALLGISGTMGLDAMAANLGTEQTNVENAFTAIGDKGGTVPTSKTSGNLASAINSIPSSAKQEKSGSFTTDSTGKKTVNCGFKPDYVVITNPRAEDDGYIMTATAHFAYNPDNIDIFALLVAEGSEHVYANSFDVEQTTSGFHIKAENVGYDMAYSSASNETFNYYAVKYE